MQFLFYFNLAVNINLFFIAIILIWLKRGNIQANKILAISMLLLAYMNIIISFYVLKTPFFKFPFLLGTHFPFEFAVSPMIFLYFKALFEKPFTFKKKYLLHFIPSLYFLVTSIPYFFDDSAEKLKYLYSADVYKAHYVLAAIFYIQFIVYIVLILSKLLKYSRVLNSNDEYTKSIKRWIKELIIFIVLVLLGNIVPVFLMPENLLYTTISGSLIYFLIIIRIVFQPEIFLYIQTTQQIINQSIESSETILTDSDGVALRLRLLTILEQEKIFLDNKLTLPDLAEKVEVPYHQLSRFINQHFKQNFNDFINLRRIEEAQKRILDKKYEHLTFEAIAQSVGFNSKTAFYAAFKKHANCSPTEFKKQQKI